VAAILRADWMVDYLTVNEAIWVRLPAVAFDATGAGAQLKTPLPLTCPFISAE